MSRAKLSVSAHNHNWRTSNKKHKKQALSGEYPAFVNGANSIIQEVPVPSVSGDLDENRGSRVPAELLWINLSTICVRAEIWLWKESNFTLILSSIKSED